MSILAAFFKKSNSDSSPGRGAAARKPGSAAWKAVGDTLDRYLLSEVLGAWAVVVGVLLAIMLATRFASFLAVAAKGELPSDLLGEVVALSSLRYLVFLMPASLLLAIILSLGRLYSDNEIAAMTGCGISLMSLYRPFMIVAVLLAVLTTALSFEVGPWAGREADFLVKDAKRLIKYTPFEAARFKPLENGHAVFYTTGTEADGAVLGQSFAYIDRSTGDREAGDHNGGDSSRAPSIVISPHGRQEVDAENGDRLITLEDGNRYEGTPGSADYEVTHFGTLTLRVSPPAFIYVNSQRKLATTSELLASAAPADRAELQARLSAPIQVLLLALLAVPLAYLAPRQGRYGKVVAGLLTYLVYANLLNAAQVWVAKGRVPALLGLSAVHLLALAIGLLLIARRQGWLKRQPPLVLAA